MTDEKRYLTELASEIDDDIQRIQSLEDQGKIFDAIQSTLTAAIKKESDLRDSCDIGVRFNVVRTQLKTILGDFEKVVAEELCQAENVYSQLLEEHPNEVVVFVYLFNASGLELKTWQKLLLPRAMIEHSVNRPIYAEKEQVEAVIRGKSNPTQLAYVSVKIKNEDMVCPTYGVALKDQFGFPLLRVRQGSLKAENIVAFVHRGQSYEVSAEGAILQKSPNQESQ